MGTALRFFDSTKILAVFFTDLLTLYRLCYLEKQLMCTCFEIITNPIILYMFLFYHTNIICITKRSLKDIPAELFPFFSAHTTLLCHSKASSVADPSRFQLLIKNFACHSHSMLSGYF